MRHGVIFYRNTLYLLLRELFTENHKDKKKNYQLYKCKRIIKFVSKPYFNILNAKPARFSFEKKIPIVE